MGIQLYQEKKEEEKNQNCIWKLNHTGDSVVDTNRSWNKIKE